MILIKSGLIIKRFSYREATQSASQKPRARHRATPTETRGKRRNSCHQGPESEAEKNSSLNPLNETPLDETVIERRSSKLLEYVPSG